MLLENPKTKDVFEVDDAHGNVLLSQGFYKQGTKKEEVIETPDAPVIKKKAGRPRKKVD